MYGTSDDSTSSSEDDEPPTTCRMYGTSDDSTSSPKDDEPSTSRKALKKTRGMLRRQSPGDIVSQESFDLQLKRSPSPGVIDLLMVEKSQQSHKKPPSVQDEEKDRKQQIEESLKTDRDHILKAIQESFVIELKFLNCGNTNPKRVPDIPEMRKTRAQLIERIKELEHKVKIEEEKQSKLNKIKEKLEAERKRSEDGRNSSTAGKRWGIFSVFKRM
ncbi:UDP-3-O-acylglucosamine N-acyltransferase [Dissostichus eleginoides]|uniref:UDP-3-O-acylglucosamine N-acyltransferase n=1 Tax=Dissostichus eleginoides TaxID=100907 RepID=A0AAD9EXK3_DISEL|nr:UDP-3-O-acylglucosamine N-acyltransferase [Dissostichus eleginoides]